MSDTVFAYGGYKRSILHAHAGRHLTVQQE